MTDTRPSDTGPRPFTTRAQARFKQGGAKRLLGASVAAIGGLLLLVFLGPDEKVVKEKFEYYGARSDEMRIMPEISIDDGSDQVRQLPKSLQVPPPPANVEILEEENDPDAIEEQPDKVAEDPNMIDVATEQPIPDAETSSDYQVEMTLPTQTSRDYYLIFAPTPEYPPNATEAERRTPVIFVNLWIFVEPDGSVSTAWVTSTNGSQVFADAVTSKVLTWEFGWLVEEKKGRQLQMSFNFKSPYFRPGAGRP